MLAAIMGVGGGFLMVPVMFYILRMPMHVIVGTSLFQILFTCIEVTFLQSYTNHTVDFVLAVLLLLGSTVGAQVGAIFGRKLKGEQLKILLAAIVLVVTVMKNHMIIKKALLIFPVMMLSALFIFINTASAQLTATANHDHITVDFFYHGSTVSVRGISDPGSDLIIKITSDDTHETLRKKGKVGGLLWMNVGELQVENVPDVYFLHSTKNISDILSNDEMNKYVIGYPALERHITMNAQDEVQKNKWFREFVKFKESSNLYAASTGSITLTDDNGIQKYYILTQWPYQALPGNYTVTVYAVKNNKVVETATSHVLVEQVGMVKSFSNMAKKNAAEYGIISILAALGAGLGVGLVFRKSGGAH